MIELKGKYNKNCKIFTDNIEQSALSTIYNILNEEAFENVPVRIMSDCLTDDAECLTIEGFKLIKNLSLQDLVANYDMETKKIFFSTPHSIIVRPMKKGEIVHKYENNKYGKLFRVSNNHRMPLSNGKVYKSDNIKDSVIGDFIFNAQGVLHPTLKYSDNDIKMICWIVCDGNIKITHNSKSDNYRIRFGLKKYRKIEALINLINSLELDASIVKSEKQTTITLSTKSSAKYLELINYKKEFPYDFIQLGTHQSQIFVNECIFTDGDYEAFVNRGTCRYNSKNIVNIDIFQAVCCINLGLSINRTRIANGYKTTSISYVSVTQEKTLKYSKSGLHNSIIRKNKDFDYNGDMVCIKCDSSFFIARQNGCTFITGNCHDGKDIVIGFTAPLTDRVNPNHIGVDIGCGVLTATVSKIDLSLEEIDKRIREVIPLGFNRAEKKIMNLPDDFKNDVENICEKLNLDSEDVYRQLGTLGGGNHFIEIGKHEMDCYSVITIHTGSRNFGKQICEYHCKKAKINKNKYLTGKDMEEYLFDMKVAQKFADYNRTVILLNICNNIGVNLLEGYTYVHSVHNYIGNDNIIRKGAISAKNGEFVVIPMNMRDGILICEGKGNKDWNESAPHGAGRIYSRSKAKKELSLKEFESEMNGVYSTSVNLSTLDESPMAYKNMEEIINNIGDTVKILYHVKPILNIKA